MTLPFSKSLDEFFDDQGFKFVADKGYLPYAPGVYAVYRAYEKPFDLSRAECIYVGQSLSLRKRLSNQHHVWRHVDERYRTHRIYYKTLDASLEEDLKRELMLLESLTIGMLRPSLNTGTPIISRYPGYKAILHVYRDPQSEEGLSNLHAISAELRAGEHIAERYYPEHFDRFDRIFLHSADEEILKDKKLQILEFFSKFANHRIEDFAETVEISACHCPLRNCRLNDRRLMIRGLFDSH